MNRKIRLAIAFEYIKVLLPLAVMTWMSIDATLTFVGIWETVQICLALVVVVTIKYYTVTRRERASFEESLGSVISSRGESAVFWDALTLAVSKAKVTRPELRKYTDDQRTFGACAWLGIGKYVIGLNEDIESRPEDANAVAAHEVGHMVLKHSVLQLWLMVITIFILVTNIMLLANAVVMYLTGNGHIFLVVVSASLVLFVFFFTKLNRRSIDMMVEHTAWLKAIELIGLEPVVGHLTRGSMMTFDVEFDEAGNMRQRIGFSHHAMILARIGWLEPYLKESALKSDESEG